MATTISRSRYSSTGLENIMICRKYRKYQKYEIFDIVDIFQKVKISNKLYKTSVSETIRKPPLVKA